MGILNLFIQPLLDVHTVSDFDNSGYTLFIVCTRNSRFFITTHCFLKLKVSIEFRVDSLNY